ncbi:hypothetical protein H6F75_00395 [Nodosilinea sp. FACHB-131]|uniref:hypothetical protein n=1 Tax=Cyanophyceae TaxID=3028117 RepID=UPI0016851CDE|nr:hypothetical protein [Nodosilinea sp. FACHB-131]MBD1871929.1 hypothetical protein [Nodosilinea sp. FACHB-131]
MNNLPPLVKDRRGMKFGRLLVKEFVKVENRRSYWLCECDCGNTSIVMGVNLRHGGGTNSCGCASKEAIASTGKLRPSKSLAPAGPDYRRLWKIRVGMIARCYDPRQLFYKDYGGRGITVCDEWLHSFDAFYFWAIASGYSPELSIDRKNNDEGYSPDNCKWSTAKEQAHNRRSSKRYEAFGESKVLEEWGRDSRAVVCKNTIKIRVANGWDFQSAMTTPAMPRRDRALLGHQGRRKKTEKRIETC